MSTVTQAKKISDGAASTAAGSPRATSPKFIVTYAVLALLTALMALSSHGNTQFQSSSKNDFFAIPLIDIPAGLTNWVITGLLVAAAVAAGWFYLADVRVPAWLHILVGVAFVIVFLTWAGAGRQNTVIPLVTILSGALSLSVPLIFGAMAGLVGERSGTVNIAIEGQLLFGAFLGAVVASMAHTAWVGIIAAPIAGMLVSALLVLFGLKYRVDQIVVGVVLNVLVLGLTNFFFSTVLTDSDTLNTGEALPIIDIPVLSRIPLIGPVLFRQTVLVYIMYIVVIVLQYMLFRSRWGLRMRACGEYPQAADTVGINVMRTRINNALLGGALAGLGGAFYTIGSSQAFSKDMAGGNGYIALAAMILGEWNPLGGVAAALLFGFAMNTGYTLSIIGSPMPSQIVLMIPYIVTILAISGFVGKVRAPAAEGVPYP